MTHPSPKRNMVPKAVLMRSGLVSLTTARPVNTGQPRTKVNRNQSNGNADTKACDDTGKARMETIPGKDYILLPLWPADLPFSQNLKSSLMLDSKPSGDNEKNVCTKELGGDSITAVGIKDNDVGAKTSIELDPDDLPICA
ncbi:hypothetical protein Tco_0162626 [Tanacetum coccineum]